MQNRLSHLAIIMDGNSRWAHERGVPKIAGHKAGADRILEIANAAVEAGVEHLTLFAFSTENWNRPATEVSYLLELMSYYLNKEVDKLHQNNIRLHVVGDLSKLEKKLQNRIAQVSLSTQQNTGLNLYIAFSYGSRQEITRACKKIIESGVKANDITADLVSKNLYNSSMPDVDLFIRTGGEKRISNFLLWQISYAELYFTDVKWPDFSAEELRKAIVEYNNRNRRFGIRSEELDE